MTTPAEPVPPSPGQMPAQMPAPPDAAWPAAFDDSRRLTGSNLFFAGCGALLVTAPGHPLTDERETAWRMRVARAAAAFGWPGGPAVARRHAGGAQLAISAPVDQLLAATSVNEWAWQAACGLPWAPEAEQPALEGDDAALDAIARAAADERRPRLQALVDAARDHAMPVLIDDETVSLGTGGGSRAWPAEALPEPAAVDWPALHGVPAALVTGSNGKTTTARLVSAIAREAGVKAGHCCTDGLFIDGQRIEAGDYAGPAGARAILRDGRVELAVLETARGGILRRGLALDRAAAAIVTNVSVDHFGEYGIDDLEALAAVKLVVARAIGPDGLLVLNADDPVLAARGAALICPIAWFALDDSHPRLVAHRARGGATCGVRDGRIRLVRGSRGAHGQDDGDGDEVDLGGVAALPLTLSGHAAYNVANLLGAALVASALGLPMAATRTAFARFGAQRSDNPGRLARWQFGGVRVILDYAHNPDGLRGLLTAATAEPFGRLALVLGQAGNRGDAEIRELAATAAAFRPALVVLKDIATMQRGRAPGGVAAVLRDELLGRGLPLESLAFESAEVDAAREALAWAQPGDVVVLPIHGSAARAELERLLDQKAP